MSAIEQFQPEPSFDLRISQGAQTELGVAGVLQSVLSHVVIKIVAPIVIRYLLTGRLHR